MRTTANRRRSSRVLRVGIDRPSLSERQFGEPPMVNRPGDSGQSDLIGRNGMGLTEELKLNRRAANSGRGMPAKTYVGASIYFCRTRGLLEHVVTGTSL